MAHKESRHKGFWWFVAVLLANELALIFLFLPGSYLEKVSLQEQQMLESELGRSTLEYVEKQSSALFEKLFLETGAVESSFTTCGYKGQDNFDDRGLGRWMLIRLQVVWQAVQQMLFRWQVMSLWLPGALIFAMPLIVDGLMQREIRKYQFGFVSPLIHRKTSLILHSLAAAMILLPLLPVSVPPLAYPAALAAGGLALWVMLINIQKRI